jgi:hypothetical protein
MVLCSGLCSVMNEDLALAFVTGMLFGYFLDAVIFPLLFRVWAHVIRSASPRTHGRR